MQFIIADTFQDSLARLDHRYQAMVKQSVFDFQTSSSHPSHQFHRVSGARDKNFWSFRVNLDLRIIVHQQGNQRLLCYVDHHDPAYAWARNRQIQVHPKTGATQIVEVTESIQEIVQKVYTQEYIDPPIFKRFGSEYLHALGVPQSWLLPIMNVTEDEFFELADRLPEEAFERLFKLAAGDIVPIPERPLIHDAIAHPDARRRFQIVDNQATLQRALDWPWEKWTIFLHPLQQKAVETTYRGPAYVSGGAGTGKTVVALHRAKALLQQDPSARLLLTTYTKALAGRLAASAQILMADDPSLLKRVTITNLHAYMSQLYRSERRRRFRTPSRYKLPELFEQAQAHLDDHSFDLEFLLAEWNAIIDPWGLTSWEKYRDFSRRGRGTPLDPRSRHKAWQIFAHVQQSLRDQRLTTWNQLCYECIHILKENPALQWDHIVVDESQDLGPAELHLIRALATKGPQDLFLVGDRGQQIYQRPFSWRQVGIEVVGRSTNLTINYRTTHEIRRFADSLLPDTIEEHGNQEVSRRTISLLNGLEPEIHRFESPQDEAHFIKKTLQNLIDQGHIPRDIALFGRTKKIINRRIKPIIDDLSLPSHDLGKDLAQLPDAICIGTMHAAKGLEFKVVILIGCEKDIIPLKNVIDQCLDAPEQDETLTHERNLLYVAATRAREQVLITHIGRPSIFLRRLLRNRDSRDAVVSSTPR